MTDPTILIVDDSTYDRILATRISHKALPNAVILTACHGAEAMEIIQHEHVDVVLTDMQMPEMNGLELVKRLRSSHPKIPVVLMTAMGSEELATQALYEGAASYIQKRSLPTHLPITLERLLALKKIDGADARVRYFSVFISHSSADQDFCRTLYEQLNRHTQVWFSPATMKGGKKIHDQIAEAIDDFDKLLVVLSKESMNSCWVSAEILRAREREARNADRVLFPIRIVPYDSVKAWTLFDSDAGVDIAKELRQYHIPDFSRWTDEKSFDEACARLIGDLQLGAIDN